MISFFKSLWKWIRRYLMFMGLAITLSSIWMFFLLFSGKTHVIKPLPKDQNLVLHLELSGPFQRISHKKNLWQKVMDGYMGVKPGPYLPDLRLTLEEAASDPLVKGLFLTLEQLQGSSADFEELLGLLERFRESGKPIQVWTHFLDTRHYFLASVGEKISIPPLTQAFILGPGFTMAYFGKALQKLGVSIDVIRAGSFKSFGESFIENTMSEHTQTMYRGLEKSLRDHLVKVIARNRAVEPHEVDEWLKDGLYYSSLALEKGIVDVVTYKEEALDTFAQELESQIFEFQDYESHHAPLDLFSHKSKEEGLALLEAFGEIKMDGYDGKEITPKAMIKDLKWAMETDHVKGVLLRIDSPGGAALAADLIWEKVDLLTKKKPVVVLIDGVGASGGYYIAAPATHIFAHPTSITGSIGVVGIFPHFSQFEEKYGISFPLVTQNTRKSLVSPGENFSLEDKKRLQESIDESYQIFLKKVADGRKLDIAKVHDMAQGRVWTGLQALELGLVDQLGGYDEAIAHLKTLCGWDPKNKYQLYRPTHQKTSLMECLLSDPEDCLGSVMDDRFSVSKLSKLSWFKEPIQALWLDGWIHEKSHSF